MSNSSSENFTNLITGIVKKCEDNDTLLFACKMVQDHLTTGTGRITRSDIKKAILENADANYTDIPIVDKIEHECGYVENDGVFGSDSKIAYCAKESYGQAEGLRKDMTYEESKAPSYAVISRLTENGHSSPFEQGSISFKLKMPIFVARQIVRHRTAKLNEKSARYTKLDREFYIPSIDRILPEYKHKDMMEDERFDKYQDICDTYNSAYNAAYDKYEKLQKDGAPFELARLVLPLSVYTELFWQSDMNNLKKLFFVRLDRHAQYEVRQVAQAMFKHVYKHFPITIGCWFWYTFLPAQICPTNASRLFD